MSDLLYVLVGTVTVGNVEYRDGDRVLLSAADAPYLVANGRAALVHNPTPLQIAEARHLALARRQSCCFGR